MKSEEYKSKVASSLLYGILPIVSFWVLMYFILSFTTKLSLNQIPSVYWGIFAALHFIMLYIYAGIVNHDVLISDEVIIIKNLVPLFTRQHIFKFKDIDEIFLRHEWTETFGNNTKPQLLKDILMIFSIGFFPGDYKWIQIHTDKKYRFYCFGIGTDEYDANEGPFFEEIFVSLRQKGLHVNWTDTSDSYYAQMNERHKNTANQSESDEI